MNDARRPRDLAHLLSRLERQVVERQRAALAAENCGVEEWRVIDFLAGGGHVMNEVAEHAGITSPLLTKLVDRLVANNIVYRRIGLEDRRKVRIFLTTRGKALHRRLAAIVEASQAELLADRDRIGGLLEDLRATIVPEGIVPAN
ncbi:MarR family winged helix-turn-helix transcriptional regulator [Amycolatopsis alkalitolerans]|uniref:MarR family transcriptional regulator n=1 Tax=Amycolatopsis alkalitolerans TaxID=2547244 RepID=A0A5C4LY65_9PSEU|nr:MarR family transcriptional regulator [Amycolatopsis alkalitolerans]TNC24419.1 MarR family transcriptional regulator [Amycolatopsis alkalitolerans]